MEVLTTFAEAPGYTLLELAFSWLGRQPAVARAIAGAISLEQVRANAAAASWRLTGANLAEVEVILGTWGQP